MPVLLESNCLDQHYGIEVANGLNWEHWQPGGEYTKQITLKNVNLKTKKLKYRIASTRFFTTRYPQPIVLGSGTSISLPITFRPLEKDTYEDCIEFITKEGQFSIPMKAILPEAQLKLPEKIGFGMCAVQDELLSEFKISNLSKLHTTFQLYCEEPFLLSPSSGTLAPRTSCKITAHFKPKGAFVYEEDAVCIFGKDKEERLEKKIKLEGIGKFSHIGIKHGKQSGDKINVEFGDVGLREIVEKTIEIVNYTAVNAPFEIVQNQKNGAVDRCFSCSHSRGKAPPNGSLKVKVSFQPECVDAAYVDDFQIIPIGGTSKAQIKCVGTGIGANLIVDATSLNFGVVKPREEVSRSFKIRNSSSLPATYQFQTDLCYSVFKLNSQSGTIKGKSSTTVIVKFTPVKPIVYYRKLFCLVHNQEPLSMKMFGTCCTNEIKPAVLSRLHLDNYQLHKERGISRLSPEYILELINEKKIECLADETLQICDKELDKSIKKQNVQLSPYEEFFNDGSDDDMSLVTPHICLDVRSINFGKCIDNVIVQKTLNVSNRTRGKVVCNWMKCENSNFAVLPIESDIQPMSTVSFTVTFRPNVSAKFYSCELEAFVFYKSMRDHRLVDEKYITPPWCLTATVTGHTFPKHHEPYLPVCNWDNLKMTFPPAISTEQSVYKTCLLQNNGDNPIHYSFDDDMSKIFSCKPAISLLRGQYQIIVFRMSPMEPGVFRKSIGCLLNDTAKYKVNFELSMTTEMPQVKMSPSDFVYFKPTCIGNTSHQKVTIHNTSRVPLRLNWKIAEVDSNILRVLPVESQILPNEVQEHKWSFTPSLKMKHLFKTKCFVSTDRLDSDPVKYVLRFIGEGQTGTISCDQSDICLGETIVGEFVRKTVQLHNDSHCSLMYNLHIHQTVSNSVISMDSRKQENVVVKLDHYEGFIPSLSNRSVHLMIEPKQQLSYNCVVSYSLKGSDKQEYVDSPRHDANILHELCKVRVDGVYPLFYVSDIRGTHCVEHHSKKYLWNQFNLTNFNNLLKMEPASMELKFHISSRHSTRRRMPVSTKAVNEFNFGSSILGDQPCVMSINIENKGASSTRWSIKYPTDLQLEMEMWADPGELAEDEMHEMFVMNSNLFTVEPKNGKIEPGQSQTVVFTYKHESLGAHNLPILFKMVQGREIRIKLVGVTLQPECSALHFTSYSHVFSYVSIGTVQPPVQKYTLNNGSGQVVQFRFDTTVLQKTQQDNYYWKIFECLTPEGEIQPHQSIDTLWIFSPIEAKSYQADVPLLISNGNTHTVSFGGIGCDPHQETALTDTQSNNDVLSKQIILVPDQLLTLSAERINFGDLPLYTEAKQIIFLANISSEKTISYKWNITGTSAENLLQIHPLSGYLQPDEKKMCKVNVFSTGPPAFHDVDITCEIIDETLMAKYNAELKTWLDKKEEQKHLFVIRDVPDMSSRNSRSASPRLKSLPTANRSDMELRRYETLPPIKSESGFKKRKIIEEEISNELGEEPVPPVRKLIHLNVSVNYHMVEEFYRLTPAHFENHFVQKCSTQSESDKHSPASKEEFVAIETILTSLAKDVIEDKDFLDSLDRIKSEATPYFSMIPEVYEQDPATTNNQPGDKNIPEVDVPVVETDDSVEAEEASPLVNDKLDRPMDVQEESDTTKATSEDIEVAVIKSAKMTTDTDMCFLNEINARQYLKRNDEFRMLLNDVLENTIYNLLCEADHGEISLTNRPRVIVLPPADVSLKSSSLT